ncbi:MAG TPA: NADH-quinone oxidoreductase subunit H [Candidatus Omnitrophota bacterium]|nr:NADH-quinone oxidoreductase subunit H [Candidatus Omnitrophota bacterium]
MAEIFNILIFPGFLFLMTFGFIVEYVDRKIYARLQNRIGPPWFQPFADFIKLASKESIIPEEANPRIFKLMPILSLASAVTAILYIPLWKTEALYWFHGDIIVTLYLLTVPAIAFFLGGWYSTSLYSKIGAVRSMTQLFAYEVPLFISILSPAVLANTWSLTEMTTFYNAHPWYWPFNIVGFFIAMIAMLGKLEKVPFDIPEAETEIVAGTFTEYSGKFYALFKLTLNIEAIVGSSLLAAVFLPFGLNITGIAGFALFIAKILFIISMLALSRTIFARFRIDQMIDFCWKYVSPVAFLQILASLALKGFLPR